MRPTVTPPPLARALMRLITPARWRDEIEGDLTEGFLTRVHRIGVSGARRWYWQQLWTLDIVRLRFAGARRPSSARARRVRGIIDMTFLSIRHTIRALRARPTYVATVTLTLAIGIGANTSMFSVVHGVLLKPLSYEQPDRLAMVFRTVPRFGFERSTASLPDYVDWRDQSTSFASMAAYAFAERTYLPRSGADRWRGYAVTANLFPMLGTPPLHGRTFTEADDRPGAAPTAMLSHATWVESFGANPAVVGSAILLDGNQVTVIGIMPPDFDFPSRTAAFWIPLQGDLNRSERDANYLTVIGRLRDGVTVEAAQAEMSALAARIDAAPDGNERYGIFVEARHAFVVRTARTAILVFQGAVALVLLLACANVANIMLSRAASRRREFALRGALGASRGRLIGQLLAESTVLSTLGGALGVIGAALLLHLLRVYGASQLPRLESVGLDPTVLLVTGAVVAGAALLCGIAPALATTWSDPAPTMKEGGQSGLGRAGRRLQESLAVIQVAFAIVLTIGAGLLLNSFVRLTSTGPGFDPTNVVAGRVTVPTAEMRMGDLPPEQMRGILAAATAERRAFFDAFRAGVEAAPGVDAAALAYGMPFGANHFSRRLLPEGMAAVEGEDPVIPGNVVDGAYFAVLGIPLRSGRLFTDADGIDDPLVAVVNEALARRFWPDSDPVGTRIRIGNGDGPLTTVVGVVGDVQDRAFGETPGPMIYTPVAQATWPEALYVLARSTAPPASIVPMIRRELLRLSPELPLTDVAAASDLIDREVAAPRFRTGLLLTFGSLAVVLALVGIYGVIAYGVGERLREIGIRIALGAKTDTIVRMVLGRGLRLAIIGIAIGGGAAVAVTRFLNAMLFGVTPTDPVTYGAAVAVLVAVAMLASYVPATRASRVDPLEFLRAE